MRVRQSSVDAFHAGFGDATSAWFQTGRDNTFSEYLVRWGVAHLLAIGASEAALARLGDLSFMAAVCDGFDNFVPPLRYWRVVGDGEAHWEEYARNLGEPSTPSESLCEDLGTVARFCANCRWDRAAIALAQASLCTHELLYDDEPEKIASALGDLAYCISQTDQAQTLEVLKRQLALLEQVCAPEDKRLLPCLHGIAVCMDDSEESLELNQRVIDQATAVHGADHNNTLKAIQARAGILANLGKCEESERLHREVLDRRTILLGPDHPDTVHTLYSLGSVLYTLGRYQEANDIYDQVLQGFEQNYGCLHPKAKRLFESLSIERVDDEDAAIDMAQRVLTRRKSAFGVEDMRTLWTQERLALILDVCGRSEEACLLLREVLEVGVNLDVFEELDAAWTSLNLARAEVALAHREEAERLYREALIIFESEWGPEDEDVIEVREELDELLSEGEPNQ